MRQSGDQLLDYFSPPFLSFSFRHSAQTFVVMGDDASRLKPLVLRREDKPLIAGLEMSMNIRSRLHKPSETYSASAGTGPGALRDTQETR